MNKLTYVLLWLLLWLLLWPVATVPCALSTALAGDRFCAACHPEVARQFMDSHHGAPATARWPGYACEHCHGGGRGHAFSMKAERITSPVQGAAVPDACAACHTGPPAANHPPMNTCLMCHRIHGQTSQSGGGEAPADG